MKLGFAVAGLAFAATAAGAQQTQIDLTPYMNDAATTYCCSSALYPTSGSATNLGVTFSLASAAGAIDVWRGEFGANRTLILPIGLSNVGNVYTLLQTRFGYAGDPNDPSTAQASLTFNFSGGSMTGYVFGCYNLRDHNPNGYSAGCWPHNAPSPAGASAQQWASYDNGSGPVVFDMQTWNLSAFAGQTLNDITIVDNGPGVNTVFLRGVTVDVIASAVPEPATFVLVGGGLFAMGLVARRRRS